VDNEGPSAIKSSSGKAMELTTLICVIFLPIKLLNGLFFR